LANVAICYYLGFQTTKATQTPNLSYPLYPSVLQLLHENHIPDNEIGQIPATGPKGRILKGDVLAYLGSIAKDYPATQASRIAHLQHLDLSNIKIAAPREADKPVETVAEVPAAQESGLPPETSIAVSISLESCLAVQKRIQDALGITVPLSTFIARATAAANESLPRLKATPPTADELFDEVLGIAPHPSSFEAQVLNKSHGDYIPDINEIPLPPSPESSLSGYADELEAEDEEDIIDFLASSPTSRRRVSRPPSVAEPTKPPPSAVNVFSLTVPSGEENRAREFLDRIRHLLQVNPGRLIL
jgi:hypothetical protein